MLNNQTNSQQIDQMTVGQTSDQMNSQINSQMNSQMNSQINSQMSGQMNSQMNSQINSQMNNPMNNPINSQMNGQLNNQQLPNYALHQPTNYTQVNYDQCPDFGHLANYSNLPTTPNHMPSNINYTSNTPNTVSFNNLVNLAGQFKMTNRVSAAESKVNKLYINSLNERRKLTVQNNLVRQASFTYNPCNSTCNTHSPYHGSNCSTANYVNYQPNSAERNHLNNLKAFLNRNQHLTNDDSHSDSECSTLNKFDYLNGRKCTLSNKCSNVELLNKNLNRPISISQQSSPSHLNYREKLCCQTRANWSKLNDQQPAQLTQSAQHAPFNQLKLISTTTTPGHQRPDNAGKMASLENLNNNQFQSEEFLQINKQIDCLKSNLYWNEKKELNYLTSSQTMPSPSKLKQQHTASSTNSFANSTITSLTNLNSAASLAGSSNSINNSIKSSINSTVNSTTTLNSSNTLNSTLNSTANNSSNTLEAHYPLTLPFSESNSQLRKISPCSSNCSLNELKKLRKDLQQSNQKVNLLTEQLNTNVSFFVLELFILLLAYIFKKKQKKISL